MSADLTARLAERREDVRGANALAGVLLQVDGGILAFVAGALLIAKPAEPVRVAGGIALILLGGAAVLLLVALIPDLSGDHGFARDAKLPPTVIKLADEQVTAEQVHWHARRALTKYWMIIPAAVAMTGGILAIVVAVLVGAN